MSAGGVESGTWATLHDEDARALDGLMACGWDPAGVDPGCRVRAERLVQLLGAVGAGGDDPDPALVDVTMARVMRAALLRVDDEPRLMPADEEALDAWVMARQQRERVPASLRARAARLEAMAWLICNVPLDVQDEALVEQTLAEVSRAESEAAQRWRLEPMSRSVRVRLGDVVSVAAMVLIGVSVAWPVLAAMRHHALRTACLGRQEAAAVGFSSYAASHREQLPVVTSALGEGRWWDVEPSRPRANSANLFELARSGFVTLDELACPGNPAAARGTPRPGAYDWDSLANISFSYQIMFGSQRPDWNRPSRVVVMTDRSPVVEHAVRGEPMLPLANSANHGGRGQHVLYNDGSAAWVYTPVSETGDNLWLPRPMERVLAAVAQELARRQGLEPLKGTETPESADDAFVGP